MKKLMIVAVASMAAVGAFAFVESPNIVGAKEAAVAAGRIGIADVETPVVLSAQIVYDAGEMLSVRNVRERIYG